MSEFRDPHGPVFGGPFRAQPDIDPIAETDVDEIQAEVAASVSRNVLAAALIVGAGFLGSRLLGLLRTVVIANAFGTSPELDAYWVAFRLPDLIFQVLTGATLGAAFIPVFTRSFTQRSSHEAWRLSSSILNIIFMTTTVVAVIAFVLAPLLVPLLAPGLGDDTGLQRELHNLAVDLTRIMLMSTVIFSVSGMFMGILNARHHFLTPALAPMLYNLAIIIAALLFADDLGVRGLAGAVVIGSLLHLAVQIPGLRAVGFRYDPIANWKDATVREVGRLMLPRVLGLGAAQINFVITVFFASIVGVGTISAVNYAWLLVMLPLGLFGMSISTAVFPTLAEHAANRSMDDLRLTVAKSLRFILYLTIPASIGLMLLGRPLIALLLQRGAFTVASTQITNDALLFFALGLFALAGTEILSRGFYAIGDTKTPVIFAVVAMVTNLIVSAVLFIPLGVRGLAIAASTAAILEFLGLFRLLRQRLGSLDEGQLAFTISRVILGTLLMAESLAVFLLIFRAVFGPLTDTLNAFVALLICAPAGAAIFVWSTQALGAEEAQFLRAWIAEKLTKRSRSKV